MIRWDSLPVKETLWEDWSSIKHLDPNIEDKVVSEGDGNVTIWLDLERVSQHVTKELQLGYDV